MAAATKKRPATCVQCGMNMLTMVIGKEASKKALRHTIRKKCIFMFALTQDLVGNVLQERERTRRGAAISFFAQFRRQEVPRAFGETHPDAAALVVAEDLKELACE